MNPLGPFVKQSGGEPVQPERDGVVSLNTNAGRGVGHTPDRLHFKKITSEFEDNRIAPRRLSTGPDRPFESQRATLGDLDDAR